MNKIIGFIGCGNMGKAMIGGIINAKLVTPQSIIVGDLNEKSLAKVAEEYGTKTTTDNNVVAKTADIIVLSVKPNLYPVVIKQIKDQVKEDVIIVTIAAGRAIEATEEMFGKKIRVVRVMPNTPALVGEAMSAICPNEMVSKEEVSEIVSIFESFGKAEIVNEKLMDVVTAVSGSSPAFVFMFIEAMADAAVLDGMPRNQAYKFAAQAVYGSAKMVLETGRHPGDLKDMVCSPSGTTIEGVAALEENSFRNAVISALRKTTQKSIELSK
ncbi:pyrroline-5-carboxylate reductase [Clostridium fermenticellae]|uniref:Pyrroline-5-carboxylate reductase n=1 Tax=Clostridium fermenticellae TaxID=2068654 RepID=A0A386H2K5_9CLOT|nr:pyrroline-5-carboxylate reductase [Clostridium fermenticellae]AYD39937.1 pyrroline-5-carboxylate reductase [Clostridium fermenticellae]